MRINNFFKKGKRKTEIEYVSSSENTSSIPTNEIDNNCSFQRKTNEYHKNFPYKSTRSCFPCPGGYLSVEDSDKLYKQNIAVLYATIAEVEYNNQFFEVTRSNIQMALNLFSFETKFERYIAFDRTKCIPILIKEENDNRMQAVELNYEQYHHLLIKLIELRTITKTTYHNLSVDDYLKIDSTNYDCYILRAKEYYMNNPLKPFDGFKETTVEHLLAPQRFVAYYQQKEYTISSPISDIGFEDYVVNLSLENETDFLVDLRDVDDVQKEMFFIEVDKNMFRVDVVGTNSVIVEPRIGNYDSLGFVYLDPRSGMGPGWEVDISLIDAVKYKRVSIYDGILNSLK